MRELQLRVAVGAGKGLFMKRLFQTWVYLASEFAERNDFEVSKVVT